MKIGQKRSVSQPRLESGWLVVLVLVFGLGLYLGLKDLPSKAWSALSQPELLKSALQGDESIPTLSVDMRFANYDNILGQREEALETGAFVAGGQDYVTATITLDNALIPVSMRLAPGPAKHLGDNDKWNFDVRTRQDRVLAGMSRFYLLDPADNNYAYQWAFSRSMEREGILATRYQFVNLTFNGDSKGIYAIQEGFGDELLTTNGRNLGVILEFDADQMWQSIAHFGSAQDAFADPVANLWATDFRYFEIDSFRDATIADDEVRSAQKETGISMLRNLQTGEMEASEIFDVDRYARFLALVDLWGASKAIELTNLRYYYNPDSARLEPISFTGNPLGGSDRLPLAAAYNDPTLQAAYVREVYRMSDPDYLSTLEAELGPELLQLQRSLNTERSDESELWDSLAARQNDIRSSLYPIQPVFAVLGPPSMSMTATIQIDVANVLNLPVEILGFDIDGLTFLEPDPSWIKTPNPQADEIFMEREDRIILNSFTPNQSSPIRYARFHLPITEIIRLDDEIDFMHPLEIQVATQILGMERPQLTLARE